MQLRFGRGDITYDGRDRRRNECRGWALRLYQTSARQPRACHPRWESECSVPTCESSCRRAHRLRRQPHQPGSQADDRCG